MESIVKVNIEQAGYKEAQEMIKQISFSIQPGEILGLIGANGAGKSTTIKAMLGMLKEMQGEVFVGGVNGRYAYIPEQPALYDEFTLWEHLELAAQVCDISTADFVERADHLLDLFHLSAVRHDLPATFSKGMQQKLMLIIAFMIRPDAYIFDEPFIGLDPRAVKALLTLVDEETRRGASVLMCTHVLDTAQRVCDRFVLLDEGTILAQGTFTQIKQHCSLEEGSLVDCFNHILEMREHA